MTAARFISVFGFLLVQTAAALGGLLIGDVTTDLAMYPPGIPVTLTVALTNHTGTNFSGSVEVQIAHLGYSLATFPARQVVNLAPAGVMRESFLWSPPTRDFQGYLVSVAVRDASAAVVESAASAVDVSSDWSRFPRYGYLAHYDAGLDAWGIVTQLKNYHINGLQFYDWQWKHHLPYSSNASWPNIASRTNDRGTLTNFIAAAHGFNLVAMNYNLYGGAYDTYLTDGSGLQLSMGIFSSARPAGGYALGNQLSVGPFPGGWATTRLYEMNNRDSGWQNFIFAREHDVFANFAFNGWHIDSLGTHTAWDYNGVNFSLDDNHPAFINNARAVLNKRMLFNSVDAGGESQIAQNAAVDFVYSELWNGNENYNDFNHRADNVRKFSSKALVLAAYLDYSLTGGSFNEPGVRLADAAMFACGAAHLELGDGDKMLHVEYFPNDTSVVVGSALAAALRCYYDFLVAYENLLRDGTVSARNQAVVSGVETSTNASAGAVWTLTKKSLGFNLLHLVNLSSNSSTLWRDSNGNYAAPPVFNNLPIKMYYTGVIGHGALWYATPDAAACAANRLPLATGADAGGNFITFTLPRLQYWDMVWLELNGTVSAGAKTIASSYDSMAAIDLEATSDLGGGQDVCCVNNTAGGSYVAFANLDFGSGALTLSARVASALANGTIEFRLDSSTGPVIATVPVGNTGGWQSWNTATVAVAGAAGVHHLFAVFKGAPSNLNWFQFSLGATNRTPVLPPMLDQALIAGATLSITNSAWDPDVPGQTLAYSVARGPAGAVVDTSTGLFAWQPAIEDANSTEPVCLTVSDNGQPPLSATQCFLVTVTAPAQPGLSVGSITNGRILLQVTGDRGPDYVLEASSNLVNWSSVLASNAPATPFSWTEPVSPSLPARFYRVRLGP